jgi:hypothetical protein
MSVVSLNEVFAKIYRFSAYDLVAFGGLFSVPRNVILVQFSLSETEGCAKSYLLVYIFCTGHHGCAA